MSRPPDAGGQPLKLWTIYRRPSDYPDHYVVRVWRVAVPEPIPETDCLLAPTLLAARGLLPGSQAGAPLRNLGREPGDDPCIVETWV